MIIGPWKRVRRDVVEKFVINLSLIQNSIVHFLPLLRRNRYRNSLENLPYLLCGCVTCWYGADTCI